MNHKSLLQNSCSESSFEICDPQMAMGVRTTQSGAMVNIGLITVNFKSAEATARLLDDIVRQDRSHCRLRVVVADNSSAIDDLDPVRATFANTKDILFLSMPSNPGYFGAAHRAFQQAWKNDPPDWLIVANPDIRLPQKSFFTLLAQIPPCTGAVLAPRIVSGRTGLDQNPFHHRSPSARRMNLVRYILRSRLLHWLLGAQSRFRLRLRSRSRTLDRSTPHPQPIYAPHGAFVIFSRVYFERGADLNVGSFLYAEEIYVAESCRRLGLPITWVPSLEVLHDEHASLGVSPAVRNFQIESADYCYHAFFSPAAKREEGAGRQWN